jgi:hypothetical protein
MARLGWRPDKIGVEQVPRLREVRPFLVFESERLLAIRELDRSAGAEAELEALMIVNWLYAEQIRLLGEIGNEINRGPFDESTARFWSWTNAWIAAGRIDVDRRCDQQNALVAHMEPVVAERVAHDRAQPRRDEILQRANR